MCVFSCLSRDLGFSRVAVARVLARRGPGGAVALAGGWIEPCWAQTVRRPTDTRAYVVPESRAHT